jgi:hypothetical protein
MQISRCWNDSALQGGWYTHSSALRLQNQQFITNSHDAVSQMFTPLQSSHSYTPHILTASHAAILILHWNGLAKHNRNRDALCTHGSL